MDQWLFEHFIQKSEELSTSFASFITEYGPIEFERRWDLPLLGVLTRYITGQLLSVAATRSIWQKIEDRRGKQSYHTFLNVIIPTELQQLGLSGAKARTFQQVALASKAGLLDEKQLEEMSSAERRTVLMQIKGVGAWTADMMEIFFFLEKDIWPVGDVAVQRTLTALTDKRRNNTRTAAHFAPYRSYLALYMWSYVNKQQTRSNEQSIL